MSMLKLLVRNIISIAASVVIITVIFTKIIANGAVIGDSMNPSLTDGDRVLVLRRSNPSRGEIIMFKAPDKDNTYYIKRVVGVPGDSIQVKDDVLYVNNEAQPEKYLAAAKKQYQAETGKSYTDDFELFKSTKRFNVPVNQYFVLGDNRPNSTDSRTFGFVNSTAIVGVVLLRYFPFNQVNIF